MTSRENRRQSNGRGTIEVQRTTLSQLKAATIFV
jgi:hypothetical protein